MFCAVADEEKIPTLVDAAADENPFLLFLHAALLLPQVDELCPNERHAAVQWLIKEAQQWAHFGTYYCLCVLHGIKLIKKKKVWSLKRKTSKV